MTWVFFRSPDFHSAGGLLGSMFGLIPQGKPLLANLDIIKVGIITVGLLACHWLMRNASVLTVVEKTPWWLAGVVWAAILMLLLLSQEDSNAFIYFQF